MNYPKSDKLPIYYDEERLASIEIPKILIKKNMKYKFVKKLKHLYLYKREIKLKDGSTNIFYECFSEFDIKVIEYYKGKVE